MKKSRCEGASSAKIHRHWTEKTVTKDTLMTSNVSELRTAEMQDHPELTARQYTCPLECITAL
jgi:hypothetical protein